MHFAHTSQRSSHTSTKLALVVVFHVLLGIGLVKTMSVRLLALPAMPPGVTVLPDVDPPLTLLPAATLPVAQLPAPPIVAPLPELPVPATSNQVTTTTTTTISDPLPPQPSGAIPTASTGAGLTGTTGTAGTSAVPVRAAAMVAGCAKPAYPAQAARNGDSGTVMLALLVGLDGRVTASRIDRSSGFRELDKAAVTALSLCTFKPAMHGDVPQAGWTQIAYDWKLE